jgi:RNA polymerase sigma-70 factor (ECF subfamily)
LVGSSADAEDITQETFIKGYAHLRRFKIEYKFLSWLFTIATNIAKNRFKHNKIVCYNLDVPVDTETGEMTRDVPDNRSVTPESSADRSDTAQLVSEMISSLPEQYRSSFLLKHQEQLSYEEIAGILKVPVSTIKIRVYRAREWLIKKYKDKV